MKSQVIHICSECPCRDNVTAIYLYLLDFLHAPTTCSILPITAEKSTPFFLPFPNQFLLLHHIQYWSLQPVPKLRLSTPIVFPLFSLTFRSPRAKTLFFKALLKSSIPKTYNIVKVVVEQQDYCLSKTFTVSTNFSIYTLLSVDIPSAGNSLQSVF